MTNSSATEARCFTDAAIREQGSLSAVATAWLVSPSIRPARCYRRSSRASGSGRTLSLSRCLLVILSSSGQCRTALDAVERERSGRPGGHRALLVASTADADRLAEPWSTISTPVHHRMRPSPSPLVRLGPVTVAGAVLARAARHRMQLCGLVVPPARHQADPVL